MTKEEAVGKIINNKGEIDINHPYKDDIVFFTMLEKAAVEAEWYEMASVCVTRIKYIKYRHSLSLYYKSILNFFFPFR